MSKLSVEESANQFGFELFKVFISRHKTEYKNLCFSPFAVFNSLAMITIGAKNTSESQLMSVLRLRLNVTQNQRSMLEELQTLRESIIKANHDIILSITYLYVDTSINLTEDYKLVLKKHFDVKPKKVTFANTEETIDTILKDAMDSTDNVIDDVIHAKDITGENKDAKLIITNSLFFRGYWATSFNELEKRNFRFGKTGEQISVEIQMMRQLAPFRYMYSQQLKAHIVSIPYVTSNLRMIVILPEEESSDAIYLIEYLNKDIFDSIMKTLQTQMKTKVDLSMPRFGLDAQKVSLQKTIKQMGAIDIFDQSLADLSGMCETNIHLTKLVHKAFILIDERGSKHTRRAQLSTQEEPLQSEKTVTFEATHPFVFIITDKITNVAVFMSYFGDPREMLEVVRETDLTPEEITKLLAETQTN